MIICYIILILKRSFKIVTSRHSLVFTCQKGGEMASLTSASYPIVGALMTAEKFLGPDRSWRHNNEKQAILLEKFYRCCRQDISKIPEIEAIASRRADEINEFLRKGGMTIQLQPFSKEEVGAATIQDFLVEWAIKGEVTLVKTSDKKEFPGVHLVNEVVKFFKFGYHPYPIAQIVTSSQDKVLMTMLEGSPDEGFALDFMAQDFFVNKRPSEDFGGLIFPMVDLNQEVDVSWLRGMETVGEDGQPAIIAQALQQNKLRMNEIGARAQSGMAVSVAKSPLKPKPDHVINQPFLVWFIRSGLSRPLFVGYIDREHWKNPGDLSQK